MSYVRCLSGVCFLALTFLSVIRAQAGDQSVAAQIGDMAITLDEVDARARDANIQPYQALYEARRQALDGLVAEVLFEREASARGVTKEALIRAEITDKVAPVTDAEVESFFNENKARMGKRTLEQAGQQIRSYLSAMRGQKLRQEFINGLKKTTTVRISLEVPRLKVQVADNDPSYGPVDAPIQIIEFSDFQCPYCANAQPALEKVKEVYDGKVRIVYRDFPLGFHKDAHTSAQAAQCAGVQGKFWEYHDKLFANQRALGMEKLKEYATEMGLDTDAFNACLDGGTYKDDVDRDTAEGEKAGVRGTPAFFINGRFLNGAQPFAAFAAIIDEELEAMEAGATAQE